MRSIALIVHITGVIFGYGPGFASPYLASALGKDETSARAVEPILARIQGTVTNVGQALLVGGAVWLIFIEHWKPFFRDRWLFSAIVVYLLSGIVAVMIIRAPATKVRRALLDSGGWGTEAWKKAVRAELIAGGVDVVAVITLLTLMVWKPSL